MNLEQVPCTPCATVGCGDNTSSQRDAEKRKLMVIGRTTCRKTDSRGNKTPVNRGLSPQRHLKLAEKKRAFSLEDLSPSKRSDGENRKPRKSRDQMPTQTLPLVPVSNQRQQLQMQDSASGLAARRICMVLVVNAWRLRRKTCVDLHVEVNTLQEQVGSLQRQTEVLRTLLDSERQRVNKALASADQSALAVQEVCRERDVIKAEKESYSHQLEELEHQLQEMHIQCLNCKNENQVIRAELSTLEAQLTKERSKLYRLREDKKILLDKVQTTDESLIIKSESLSHVQTSCRELQTKLLTQTQQTSLTKTQLAEANSTVAMMKKQECQLRGEIAEMKRTFGELLVSVEELESKLASKVLANQELEVKIHEQNRELKELRERLSEALQCQESWQFRAVRVVSLCLHYPYYLLQGLVYLYNTAN